MRLLTLAMVAFAGCGGPPDGQCAEQKQCGDGFNCREPDYQGFCTSSTTTSPECDVQGIDPLCEDPKICWFVDSACGVENKCKNPCTADADCSPDDETKHEICRPEGWCSAADCNVDEYTCTADATCETVGGDLNGCVHPACTDDSACGEDQHCVMGRCFLTYGECLSDLL